MSLPSKRCLNLLSGCMSGGKGWANLALSCRRGQRHYQKIDLMSGGHLAGRSHIQDRI